MRNGERAARGRSYLDVRFHEIGPSKRFARPAHGWVKAIRQGLGMKSAQLATRLGVKQPSVVALEQSEAKGTIELRTLTRAAAALDCTLVYALVPNKPLERTIRERALNLLRQRRAAVEYSMMLENQAVRAGDVEANLDEFIREINPSQLWEEV